MERLTYDAPTILTETAPSVSYDDGTVEAINATTKAATRFAEDQQQRQLEEAVDRAKRDGERAALEQGIDFEPVTFKGAYAKQFNASGFATASVDLDIKTRQAVSRISQKHPMNPAAQSAELEKYADSFAAELPQELLTPFRQNMAILSAASVESARAKADAFKREEARANFFLMEDTFKNDVNTLIRPMFDSGEASVSGLAALEQMRKNYSDHLLNNGPGVPFNLGGMNFPANINASRAFSVGEIASKLEAFDTAVEQKLLEVGATKMLLAEGDPEAALEKFAAGELILPLPDAEGNVRDVNVFDVATPATARIIEGIVSHSIAEKDAAFGDKRRLRVSNYELAIASIETEVPFNPEPNMTGPQQPVLTKQEKLANIIREIDNDSVFSGVDGKIKANDLKKKVLKAMDKENERIGDVALGAGIASGTVMYNPNDSKQKKAFGEYYKTQTQHFANLDPVSRNAAKTQIITTANVVPDIEKGFILNAARSQNVDLIKEAADLVDRVSVSNPHLSSTLGSPQDLSRLRMINERVEAGLLPEEAIKVVDERLDPRNAASTQQINEEIKQIETKGKIKSRGYRARTLDALDTFGDELSTLIPFGRDGLDVTEKHVREQVDQAEVVYRTTFKDAYAETRDFNEAERRATGAVVGQFTRTKVNGKPQIMRYAPEQYYSINGLSDGQNRKWMQEQMIEQAQRSMKDILLPRTVDKRELRKNLVLVPDFEITGKTAALGTPEYKLVLMLDDVPYDVTGGPDMYFSFDKEAAAQGLLDDEGFIDETLNAAKGLLD